MDLDPATIRILAALDRASGLQAGGVDGERPARTGATDAAPISDAISDDDVPGGLPG